MLESKAIPDNLFTNDYWSFAQWCSEFKKYFMNAYNFNFLNNVVSYTEIHQRIP